MKLINEKKVELAQRYTDCQNEADYADIWIEENEIYNHSLLSNALNAGQMYIYSQFEKQIIVLARLVDPRYTLSRG